MTSRPDPSDERLLAAHDLARAALREVTPEASIGDAAGYKLEDDGVVSLRFNNRLGGYPGWFWTVSIAAVEDSEPTVLEVELLPGDGALLAPEWVPWAVRLAEYQAAQAVQAAAAAESGELAASDDEDDDDLDDEEDDGDDVDDLDDLDASDFDDDGSAILHGGDLDGVDIDELDESAVDDDEDADIDELDELDESAVDDDEDADEDDDESSDDAYVPVDDADRDESGD
ncbi:DUF3027 domain-containing protein [Microbacterium sp. zg-YB36]|uniref:DUF3027 domain-containing protein n=1 Tax=Microbacterium sp. zg-YB36 TaxID=2969407 RepID=UPI00214A959D|nr:DUF3027 domain-containing protein [Microbacterium sp. zg-YB36]MDL5350976.1 DUF3027 domain-containing protein [Microbacterium sp. zg-YB36]